MFSHGSIGAAAPHADHHDAQGHDTHGETVSAEDLHPLSSNSDEPGSDVGHVTHVHVVAALPDLQAFDALAPVASSLTVRPLAVAELVSRGVPPLLEPPSA